ncbi:spore photoproduct lyase family protein [Roseicella frigidaeris]|uniref:Spore photoproduct lyase family protein n=1 Tax=Roseicella frigidaeris TaxID=2230885 RepID=A0A327M9N5_9PROT|nr:spore photoproduct lyase family protein [Roseicella frigidaeris]RAI59022.1 spore photoproduct lyase family protein [Roseicella frigidaeris]
MTGAPATPLLDIRRIYCEPAAAALPRGAAILARFPAAERIPVESHWRIPALREGDPGDYLRPKRETLVLGVKQGLGFRPNGRSADFIAPSTSNGCAMACAYCYVARRKGHANPITAFANIEAILAATARHAARLGPKPQPNQVDPAAWVYDLGENGDLSVDALISDNVRDLVALFRTLPNAKGSFATKGVNPALLDYDPQGRTRIRMSLMPPGLARLLDVRAAPVEARIAALPELHRAGYEVQVNFSPVVLREGWEAEWAALFQALDDALPAAMKPGLAAEVIMLTHNAALHEMNLAWHPKAEALLWRPDLQEEKRSGTGAVNLRYRAAWKARWLARFQALLAARLPYCRVRYAF